MKKVTLIVFVLFTTNLSYSQQQAIIAAGGDATGSGGSYSYSVGQLFLNTSKSSGSLAGGIQQGFEFISNTLELSTIQLKFALYPNPITDYVILASTDASLKNLNYTLHDMLARTISKGQIRESNTKIIMNQLDMGTYILNIYQNNNKLKTFKIIKK
jgi:hypothetical protein